MGAGGSGAGAGSPAGDSGAAGAGGKGQKRGGPELADEERQKRHKAMIILGGNAGYTAYWDGAKKSAHVCSEKETNTKVPPRTVLYEFTTGDVKDMDKFAMFTDEMPFAFTDMKSLVIFDGPRGHVSTTLQDLCVSENVAKVYNHGSPTKTEFKTAKSSIIYVPVPKSAPPLFKEMLAATRRPESLAEMVWIVYKDGNRKIMPRGVALVAKRQIIATVASVRIA